MASDRDSVSRSAGGRTARRRMRRQPAAIVRTEWGIEVVEQQEQLIETIRAGIIGDDRAIDGPFGPRRMTYADYTASGRSLGLHRGFHPRRGAAAVRQHPHRDLLHRAADHPLPRGRAPHHPPVGRRHRRRRGDLLRIGRHRRYQQADRYSEPAAAGGPRRRATTCRRGFRRSERPVVFIGPYEHHSNEIPWRETIADVVVIAEDHDGRIDQDHLERELGDPPRAPAQDRQLLGGLQRHRHHLRHRRNHRAAPPARGARLLGLRGRGALRGHRDEPGGHDRRRPRTRSSSRPTSSSAVPAPRACWWSSAGCSPTGCRPCPAAAP